MLKITTYFLTVVKTKYDPKHSKLTMQILENIFTVETCINYKNLKAEI